MLLRRFVVLVLAGLLAVALFTGCGGQKQEEPAMEQTPPATEQAAPDTTAAATDTGAAMQDTTK
jgi:hypothetical protein